MPLMNFRLNRPDVLVDINDVTELTALKLHDSRLEVGSLVRHQQLAGDPLVVETIPVLAEAAGHIGHWAIRNRGTIGGSVAHADPAAELPALLTALNATIVAASSEGEQQYRADEFFLGYFTTALAPDQLVLRIDIPVPADPMGFSEVVRRPGDFALVGAVTERGGTGGAVTWFGLGGRPERYVVDQWPDAESGRQTLLTELVHQVDLPADDEYKRDMAVVVAMRALRHAEEGR